MLREWQCHLLRPGHVIGDREHATDDALKGTRAAAEQNRTENRQRKMRANSTHSCSRLVSGRRPTNGELLVRGQTHRRWCLLHWGARCTAQKSSPRTGTEGALTYHSVHGQTRGRSPACRAHSGACPCRPGSQRR